MEFLSPPADNSKFLLYVSPTQPPKFAAGGTCLWVPAHPEGRLSAGHQRGRRPELESLTDDQTFTNKFPTPTSNKGMNDVSAVDKHLSGKRRWGPYSEEPSDCRAALALAGPHPKRHPLTARHYQAPLGSTILGKIEFPSTKWLRFRLGSTGGPGSTPSARAEKNRLALERVTAPFWRRVEFKPVILGTAISFLQESFGFNTAS